MDTFKCNEKAIQLLCKQFYTDKDYTHAERVANFAHEDIRYWQDKDRDFVMCLAWAHDLYEDTNCPHEIFTPDFDKALHFITWYNKETTYDRYLELIKKGRDTSHVGHMVWWVKLLDMKDHLTQTDTLTDKLKEKYLSGLRYLL
ncbi:MAG: hypothetical protein LIO71_03490 [Ruminococcus sp.]|nr:hypothetical protein [Ruminococcus sp.]